MKKYFVFLLFTFVSLNVFAQFTVSGTYPRTLPNSPQFAKSHLDTLSGRMFHYRFPKWYLRGVVAAATAPADTSYVVSGVGTITVSYQGADCRWLNTTDQSYYFFSGGVWVKESTKISHSVYTDNTDEETSLKYDTLKWGAWKFLYGIQTQDATNAAGVGVYKGQYSGQARKAGIFSKNSTATSALTSEGGFAILQGDTEVSTQSGSTLHRVTPTEVAISGNSSFVGLRYNGDYSANFGDNSIPNRLYNDARYATPTSVSTSINTRIPSILVNRIPYSNGTNYTSSANLTFNGNDFTVTGTGTFTGTNNIPLTLVNSSGLTNNISFVNSSGIGATFGTSSNNDVLIQANATNKSVVLQPNGSGVVDVSGKKITNLAEGTSYSDAVHYGQFDGRIANPLGANVIPYSTGSRYISNTGFTYNGSSLGVTGTGVFSGTVSGANATSAGHFTTLSQLQSTVSGTTNTIPRFTGTNTIGNSALTDISSVLTYTGESRATRFTSTGTATTGRSYLKNQFVGIPSEGQLDYTSFIWGDRDYMKDVALWGDVTIAITGAGTFTDTRANKNNLFDLAPTNFVLTGLDATSTAITITCDLKAPQDIYARGQMMPYVVYRRSTQTRYNACKVEISLDNISWFTITDATNILSEYNIAWFSQEVAIPLATNYTFRYIRYTLTDKVSATDNSRCDISMVGLKNINAPFFPSIPTKAGGNFWGNLQLYQQGTITSPTITLNNETGTISAANATASNHLVTLSQLQNAANITTGTLADARLSSNVALKNIDNNFSSNQTISNGNDQRFILNKTSGTEWNYMAFSYQGTRRAFFGVSDLEDLYFGVDAPNKNVVLVPNGTGVVNVSNKRISAVANGTASTDAVNLSQLQNAANITTGTLADARLSSNVSLDNINNNFSVPQTVPNATLTTHAANLGQVQSAVSGVSAQLSTLSATNNTIGNFTIDFENRNMAVKPVTVTFGVGSAQSSTVSASNLKNGSEVKVYWKADVVHNVTYNSAHFKKIDGSALATCNSCNSHILTFTVIDGVAYLSASAGVTTW